MGVAERFQFSGTLRRVDVSDVLRTYVNAVRNYLASRKRSHHNLIYQKCLDYYVLYNMIRQMESSRITQAENFSCTRDFKSRIEQKSNWVRGFSVPMHLGLKTGPMCPTLWCQVMEALVLHSSSRLLPDSDPDIIWVQNGAHIKLKSDAPFPEPSFIYLSKVPENEPPPGSPVRALTERSARFQRPLEHISQVPHKSSDNRNFSLLSKALGKQRPAMFPKTGPLWRELPVSRALLSISFRAPSKEASPPGSPQRGGFRSKYTKL